MRVSFLIPLAIATGVVVGITPLPAAVPQLVNYQGELTDGSGNHLDTTVTMVFGIYDVPVSGFTLWTEQQDSVKVVDGRFNVLLGAVVPLPDSVFSDSTCYLGVRVGGDPELSPRTRFVSVAFSQRVATVDGATGGTINGKVSIGSGNDNAGIQAFVAGENNGATGTYATVGGGSFNNARGAFSTVAGGGATTIGDSNSATGAWSTIGGGWRHLASGLFSTIGGGDDQTASGDYSVVTGGNDNGATAPYSVVVGGQFNQAGGAYAALTGGLKCTANGDYSSTPGGRDNSAAGAYSFAAGRDAKIAAAHGGTFVFADSLALPFTSVAANEFAVRARGGVRLVTGVDGLGAPTTGACLAAGSGSWASCSDRKAKENIRPVTGSEVLERLAGLPISSWNYKSQPDDIRHIGPMAQDFYAAFDVGDDARFITSIDADGVALAAIQELYRRTQDAMADNARVVDSLRAQIQALRETVARLSRTSGR